jgi:hypothetical protein
MALHPDDSLRVLLTNLFDYAGMFPPASRSFEAALQESSSFTTTLSRPWMVSSDIVLDTEHAHKLLGVNLGMYAARTPFRVCLLATEDPDRVMHEAAGLLRREPKIEITSLEVKASPELLGETLEQYGSFTSSHGIPLCIEPNLAHEEWREALRTTVDTLRISPTRPALKCRLTGPTGISSDRFAAAITATNEHGIPLKVTGGLHHPIVEPDRYPFPMGFLNVSVAVMLHRHLGDQLSVTTIEKILTNQDPKTFTFGEYLGFRDFKVSVSELRAAKERGHFAIGSCSIHEPDRDLSRLFPPL